MVSTSPSPCLLLFGSYVCVHVAQYTGDEGCQEIIVPVLILHGNHMMSISTIKFRILFPADYRTTTTPRQMQQASPQTKQNQSSAKITAKNMKKCKNTNTTNNNKNHNNINKHDRQHEWVADIPAEFADPRVEYTTSAQAR